MRFTAAQKDGKIIKVQGDPDHPVTKGNICNKVRNMTARLYDPNRLKQPLKRIGPKGKGISLQSAGKRPLTQSLPNGKT